MAEYLVNAEDLSNIANAIREKSGESGTIRFDDFASKIRNMPSGSGGGLVIDTQGSFKVYIRESHRVRNYDSGKQIAVRLDVTDLTGYLEYNIITVSLFGKVEYRIGGGESWYYPNWSDLSDTWIILPRCSTEGEEGFDVTVNDDGGEFGERALTCEWGYLESSEVTKTLQEKTVTKNGTYEPDPGYDGFKKFTVNVESTGGSTGGLTIPVSVRGYGELYPGCSPVYLSEHDPSTLNSLFIAIRFTSDSDSMTLSCSPINIKNDFGTFLLGDNSYSWLNKWILLPTSDNVMSEMVTLSWPILSYAWEDAMISYEWGTYDTYPTIQ